MKHMTWYLIPLQFFADGGEDAGGAPENKPENTQEKPAGNTTLTSTTQIKPGADPEALADKLLKALEKRTERAERSTLRSMAEGVGFTAATKNDNKVHKTYLSVIPPFPFPHLSCYDTPIPHRQP